VSSKKVSQADSLREGEKAGFGGGRIPKFRELKDSCQGSDEEREEIGEGKPAKKKKGTLLGGPANKLGHKGKLRKRDTRSSIGVLATSDKLWGSPKSISQQH